MDNIIYLFILHFWGQFVICFFLDMNTLDRFGASHTHCTQGCEALDAAVDQIAESGLQLLLVRR